MKFNRLVAITCVVMSSADLLSGTAPAAADFDALVSVGSPTDFPQNEQNEPALAVDANHPNVLAAGSNDAIDNEPCSGNECTFTSGISFNGLYFSFDAGATWTQPTYSGLSARTGTAQPGPIGTVPWYFESGLETLGDPWLAFGPVPGPDGRFSWANGSRLYYSTLAAAPLHVPRQERSVKGVLIAVSRTDDVQTASLGGAVGKNAWMPPVIVSTKDNPVLFDDKEAIWADNAESSPHFGTVYACFGSFSIKKTSRVSLRIARSTDGGATWSSKQVTAATPTGKNQFWNGCTLRTDSRGTVYVFFEGSVKDQRVHMMVRSFDGGVSFERARPVAPVTPVGAFDAFQDRLRFDGVRGGRTNSDPSVDISNGAPTGDGATDQIVLAWSDGRDGLNHEELLVQSSRDRGETWSTPVNLAEDGDRPNFPAVAISPDGEDLYLVYNAHLDPYRSTTVQPRRMQGVVRHAEVSVIDGQISNVTTLHRGAIGDTRGAGGNLNPFQEFLGDYNNAVATNDYGSAVWVDARNAAVCPAVNDYRELFLIGGSAITPPFLATDCPFEFGNTDIFGFTATDPTP